MSARLGGNDEEKSEKSQKTQVPTPLVADGHPIGLIGFGIITLQESILEVLTLNKTISNTEKYSSMYGQSLFVGGLIQIISSIFELINGNSLTGAAFGSFGAFWLSKGLQPVILKFLDLPSGNVSSHDNNMIEGIMTIPWSLWVFIMLLANIRKNLSTRIMFILLNCKIHLLTISHFVENESSNNIHIVAGYFGILLALAAYYELAAILINKNNSFINIPRGKNLMKTS
ncbi:Meiotically up-regulated gene 86 protein [Smittium mucronatum]|uniref:Meiotically up-regulated gene 86 protein n=1 Tax=Smittium mucronatum TaxID=133383 RepID=A0A1R0GN55_9FUNG|nr:Meiotically up-regulated gene 86 protein [Smittium mucronatum]